MVENIEIIKEEMAKQNKGLLYMANTLSTSTITISNCRSGKNVTVATLEAVTKELGLKIVIMKDEKAKPEIRIKKKPGKHRKTEIERIEEEKKVKVPTRKIRNK